MLTRPHMNDRIRQAYETLELQPGADEKEVRQAFKDLAQVWHPDRFEKHNERLQTKAAARFVRITQAHDDLRAWLKTNPSPGPPPPPPQPRPQPSPPPPKPRPLDRGKKARRARERARRQARPVGPWEALDEDHAVIQGQDQVVVLSHGRPLPVAELAYEHGFWVSSVAAGPKSWLTVLEPSVRVEEQRVQLAHVTRRMAWVQDRYDQDFHLTGFGQAPDGVCFTVMTKGTRRGSEHYKSFAEWPPDHARVMRSDHGEALTTVVGSPRHWHLVSTQQKRWGGQRVSTREDWEGLKSAIQTGWDEGRRITSLAWSRGLYAVVTTKKSGIQSQTYAHCKDVDALRAALDEQWGKGRVVTQVCHDEDGWLLVLSAMR